MSTADCSLTEWGGWSECATEESCGTGSRTIEMIVPEECPVGTVAPSHTEDCYAGDCGKINFSSTLYLYANKH